jgi:hypothetical protein
VFPAGITVRVASARDGSFDPERWWEKRESIKLFGRELAAMVVAMWELREPEKQSTMTVVTRLESALNIEAVDDKDTKNVGKPLLALYKS